MQEGILALMQLPKTICAIDELHEAGGEVISVLTHPTTGGVLASFASLGDVVVAEPGALMSFAGPRVVAQTTREISRTISVSRSRTSGSAISTQSSPARSSARHSGGCSGCSLGADAERCGTAAARAAQ
jgi:hypothetical protein